MASDDDRAIRNGSFILGVTGVVLLIFGFISIGLGEGLASSSTNAGCNNALATLIVSGWITGQAFDDLHRVSRHSPR
jgi:hypothetical protein